MAIRSRSSPCFHSAPWCQVSGYASSNPEILQDKTCMPYFHEKIPTSFFSSILADWPWLYKGCLNCWLSWTVNNLRDEDKCSGSRERVIELNIRDYFKVSFYGPRTGNFPADLVRICLKKIWNRSKEGTKIIPYVKILRFSCKLQFKWLVFFPLPMPFYYVIKCDIKEKN